MSRIGRPPAPKTTLVLAYEQFECSRCGAQPEEPCVSPKGVKRYPHTERIEQMCGATFMGLPALATVNDVTWPMFCSKAVKHSHQHRTPDKRLAWSKELTGTIEDLLAS